MAEAADGVSARFPRTEKRCRGYAGRRSRFTGSGSTLSPETAFGAAASPRRARARWSGDRETTVAALSPCQSDSHPSRNREAAAWRFTRPVRLRALSGNGSGSGHDPERAPVGCGALARAGVQLRDRREGHGQHEPTGLQLRPPVGLFLDAGGRPDTPGGLVHDQPQQGERLDRRLGLWGAKIGVLPANRRFLGVRTEFWHPTPARHRKFLSRLRQNATSTYSGLGS